MAKGDDDLYNAFDTAKSATGSETGSSDVPQTASPSIPDTMAASRASRDSESQKRKSTDAGSIMSKGKKIQCQISGKTKGIQIIVETCKQLVKINERLVDEVDRVYKIKEERYRMLDEKKKEFDKCLEKLNNLAVDSIAFHMIRGQFKDPYERQYFLQASEEEITGWISWLKFQQSPNFGMSPNIGMNPQGGLHPQGGMNPQIIEVGRANKIKEERYRMLDEKEKEFDKCLEKLNNLAVDSIAFHMIRGQFKDPYERIFLAGI